MMKSNFTPQEIANVIYSVGNIFNVTINKAGNIKLRWKIPFITHVNYEGKGEKFYTFYKKHGKIIIRSMTKAQSGIFNVYPLNMKRTKAIGGYGDHTWTYQAYNIDDSYFNNIENALEYFETYLEKYYADYVAKCEAA